MIASPLPCADSIRVLTQPKPRPGNRPLPAIRLQRPLAMVLMCATLCVDTRIKSAQGELGLWQRPPRNRATAP